jgi:AmmeMemoRadiSam system protein B
MNDIRPPAVSGSFYPSDPDELRGILEDFLEPGDPSRALGVIAPHAGLVYSGACAGKVFSRVEIPQLCVILAPNHTGMGDGASVAVWDKGFYSTPLGESRINSEFIAELTKVSDLVRSDRSPHFGEHAVEVIMPFLQFLTPTTSIVPLILPWDSWAQCQRLAQDLVEVITNWPADVLLIASSDMTHHESADRALYKDTAALEAITMIDGERLLEVCRDHSITMCGRGPAAVVLEACRLMAADTATVTDYRHSGMITGDDDSVVSYAGVVLQ